MPHSLTDDPSSFPANVTGVDTADDATEALFDTPFQQLANRTAWLKALCTALGVPHIAAVADVAALKAIDTTTGINGDDVRLVTGLTLFGLFAYAPTSTAAETLPVIVAPTTGPGRWFNVIAGMLGANNGIASLSSTGKLVQRAAGTTISAASVASSSLDASSSTSYVPISGMSVVVTAVAGDLLLIDWGLDMLASTASGAFAVEVNDGGSPANIAASVTVTTAGGVTHAVGSLVYTVVSTGFVVVNLMQKAGGGGSTTPAADPFQKLRVVQVRP